MTDDISRGLAALADEARPASIDSHTVVQLAHAHTRARRAIVASAFATVVAAGALVAATTLAGSSGDGRAAAPPAASSAGEVVAGSRDPATPEENAARKPRLQAEMTAAFDRILPGSWQHSTFGFGCDQTGCFAEGDLVDEHGAMAVHVYASTVDNFGEFTCGAAGCVHADLDDGTTVSFHTETSDGPVGGPEERVSVSARRPDGTVMSMSVRWPGNRPVPELTDEQWMEFGKALTY